jgi:hypothetical protein
VYLQDGSRRPTNVETESTLGIVDNQRCKQGHTDVTARTRGEEEKRADGRIEECDREIKGKQSNDTIRLERLDESGLKAV